MKEVGQQKKLSMENHLTTRMQNIAFSAVVWKQFGPMWLKQ